MKTRYPTRFTAFLTSCFFLFTLSVSAQTIATFTAGMDKKDGFMPFYWDAKKGKVYLEIGQFDTEFLYFPSLAQGVGSNDIGLDRGRLGDEHVVKFQRTGPKVLLTEGNSRYRAITSDPLERRAVEESFAKSVHWGFDVVAEEGGRVLVDLTPFLMQDAVGVTQAITQTRQGSFRMDQSRSVMYLPNTRNFPQNTEFEVTTTFTGDNPGQYLRSVVPTATMVTVNQHHSFVQLPDNKYEVREFDPRIGYGGIEYFDYATPVGQPIMKRYISRHRLEKKDPKAAISDPVKPIVYYLDPGTPEPIRTALLEGTAWWNQAFEAAGYRNAFQVKLLPADADPMDIRYNLVQWVHRSTRGWSYGASVIDPRTGEILKGKVTLGSLRVRQDYLIAQGLVGKFEGETPPADFNDNSEMMKMSLNRLRQLAAHEVGHTLGLPHNYVASTQSRASVMDYPHMVAKLKGATVDLSDAYALGIGDYDKWSIIYGYQDFPDGADEKKELAKVVEQMHAKGLTFLTDQDARPEGSVHPKTHLWDNGADATDELKRVSELRKVVLSNFNEKKIPVGTPLATLEEVFVPMYMFHRFQTEATAKVLGGMNYTNALRGDGQPVLSFVSADDQTKALNALLSTLTPQFLAVPDAVLKQIPPRAFRYNPNQREVFKRHTGLSFDPLGPPEAAAGMTIRLMLNPDRAARLARQPAFDAKLPGLDKVISALVTATFGDAKTFAAQKQDKTYAGDIRRMVQQKVVEHLIQLAVNKENDVPARAAAHEALMQIKLTYPQSFMGWIIRQYEENPDSVPLTPTLTPPDGQPIDPGQEWLQPDCEWVK